MRPRFQIDDGAALYYDAGETTPIGEVVRNAMVPYLYEKFGDPEDISVVGKSAAASLADYREDFLDLLGVPDGSLWFTSSGTEANNWVVNGVIGVRVCSAGEHLSVLGPVHKLDGKVIPLGSSGLVDLGALEEVAQAGGVGLVSIQYANSETGIIQEIRKVSNICKEHCIPLHVDASIAFCVESIDMIDIGADFLTLSGHKAWGPLGVGALVSSGKYEVDPWMLGGGQEEGMRAGPVNMAAIAGFHAAAMFLRNEKWEKVRKLRDSLESELRGIFPDLVVHGDGHERLPNLTCLSFPGADSTMMSAVLESKYGIIVGVGGVSEKGTSSRVLESMGVSRSDRESSIRLRFGCGISRSDIDLLANGITIALRKEKFEPII